MLPTGGFDSRYRVCEDWDLWIRLAQHNLPACVPKPLVGYRVHPGNSSFDTATFLAEAQAIETRYGGPLERVVLYRHVARLQLRMNRQWPALRFYLRAARNSGRYLAEDFAIDVLGVVRSTIDRVRGRLGRRRRLPERQRRREPDAAWHKEARTWLDEFISRHPV